MSIKEIITNAELEINSILTDLESELKSNGLKVSEVSINRIELNVLGQREADPLFTTEVHVEVRR